MNHMNEFFDEEVKHFTKFEILLSYVIFTFQKKRKHIFIVFGYIDKIKEYICSNNSYIRISSSSIYNMHVCNNVEAKVKLIASF